jgi:hypothetical protein
MRPRCSIWTGGFDLSGCGDCTCAVRDIRKHLQLSPIGVDCRKKNTRQAFDSLQTAPGRTLADPAAFSAHIARDVSGLVEAARGKRWFAARRAHGTEPRCAGKVRYSWGAQNGCHCSATLRPDRRRRQDRALPFPHTAARFPGEQLLTFVQLYQASAADGSEDAFAARSPGQLHVRELTNRCARSEHDTHSILLPNTFWIRPASAASPSSPNPVPCV